MLRRPLPWGRRVLASALKLGAVSMLAAMLVSVEAATEDGDFRVRGAGVASCATFNEAVAERNNAFLSFAGWLEGHLTAMNRTEDGFYDLVSWQGTELLLGSLDAYCRERPEESFHVAVVNLARRLLPTAIREKPAIVSVEDDEGRAYILYDAVVRRIQAALRQRNFYEGDLTGEYSDVTRRAVAAFQESKGLEATGLPDQRTLANLLP